MAIDLSIPEQIFRSQLAFAQVKDAETMVLAALQEASNLGYQIGTL
ncbi:hypothetical protein [Iningainema tapete]|uniref:Uncharacterized protein n=1 Tax=Iningainema tapete BLCC-T55 TaxID=2748662 RepID=A0A8J6XJN2_9CYAN|nr:hypothetical protein [Iningainema tapete]MBD2775763.1 hypothetical protein [Iningainema tapete BLCC-T55]